MTIKWTYAEITEFLNKILDEGTKFDELVKVIDRETQAPFFITPLMIAVLNFDLNSLRLLLKGGANIEIRDEEVESGGGRTVLHYAARFGIEPIVHELVLNKANVNALDGYKRTPLWYAVNHGHLGVVQFLLKNGAKPDVKRKSIWGTTLIAAVKHDRSRIVSVLLKAGADPNACDWSERTPLMCAAINHNASIIKELLEYDVDISQTDKYGYDALWYAALGNDGAVNTIDILLKGGVNIKGANISKKYKHEMTVIDRLNAVIAFMKRSSNVPLTDEQPL